MNRFTDRLRTALLICCVVIVAAGGGIKLMKVQVVDSKNYSATKSYSYSADQIIHATRGEIHDADGKPIVQNRLGFNLNIEKAELPEDNEKANRVLLETAAFLTKEGYKYNDSLPVSASEPFEFLPDADEDTLDSLKASIGVNVYATAENCMDKLIEDYEISDKYSAEQKRIISGIRYEMKIKDFSLSNIFTLCENISLDTVTKIKELSLNLPGIEVSEEAIRTNPITDVIPHEIGTVGPIYAEEYEELSQKGYLLSDKVGKSGLEAGMEQFLRGENGIKKITVSDSSITTSEIEEPAVPGKTLKLTVKSDFQRAIQKELEDFMTYLNNSGDPDIHDVSSGAVVVLDAKNNDVLAMATAPTYTLDEYIENYSDVLNREGTPLLNRATDGLYRPGSAFKTVTATAGLNEGFVDPSTQFYCGKSYQFYDIEVFCTGYHQYISASEAIRVSCNCYFYELSRKVGIDNIVKYANLYGLGTELGLESGDTKGYISCPDTVENLLGDTWYSGNLLQTAIGQSETKVTPLQMAVQASTIANRGVRYKPHLVGSILDYTGKVVDDVKPEVAQKIDLNYDYVYDTIIAGMIGASHNTPNGEYSLNNLGYDVAIKTGTPQTTSSKDTNTTVIGFAPADDPVIAFSAVIEKGTNSKYLVRKIIDCYNKYYNNAIK